MKRIFFFSFITLLACNQSPKNGDIVPEDQLDKVGYSFGYDIGQRLKASSMSDIDPRSLAQGIQDAFNDSAKFSNQEIVETLQNYQQQAQQRQQLENDKVGAENAVAGEKFLTDNAQREGVITTESGLQYEVLIEGSGAQPKASDRVSVHYKGYSIDGTVFDSSYDRGQPAEFPLDGVIRGWQEGVGLMKEGAKYKLFVPGDLGYGAQGAGSNIGPNETLIFEVELLKVLGK